MMSSNTPANPRVDLIEHTCKQLLDALLLRLESMSRDTTTDSVHESRIAIRRLRVALRAMKPYLKDSMRRRYVSLLRDLTLDLEQSRDADIRELNVNSLIGEIAIEHRTAAHRLLVLVAAQRAKAAHDLKSLTKTLAWRRRLAELRRFSREPLILKHEAGSLQLIREAIAHRERRLKRQLQHIVNKPHKLHRLRLRIKAQRYLEEDFLSVPGTSPDRDLGRLRQLQAILGEYHDNWRLKKWLRTQSASRAVVAGLRRELNAQQTRLFKTITRLGRGALKTIRA